jgi:DNA modification methylase
MDPISQKHTVHPFPARMASSIALGHLPATPKARPLTVLDPMAGSGTTLVAARMNGHLAVGIDTDPLAIIISKTRCQSFAQDKARELAAEIIKKVEKKWSKIPAKSAYPHYADDETCEFIDYWFDTKNKKQLVCLSRYIEKVRDKNLQNILWCAFSRLIITKNEGASLARDLSHSRPHKAYKKSRIHPASHFCKALEKVILGNPFKSTSRLPNAKIRKGDARALPLKDASVDVVITSPPYLNAIDYVRCSKFSLVWMGYNISDLRSLRSTNIGAERKLENAENEFKEIFSKLRGVSHLQIRHQGMLLRYISDIHGVVSEISRVIIPGGKVVFVVGNSNLNSIFINNAKIVALTAESLGLKLLSTKRRKIPSNRRYLPPPSSKKSSIYTRMREEVILAFVKKKSR